MFCSRESGEEECDEVEDDEVEDVVRFGCLATILYD